MTNKAPRVECSVRSFKLAFPPGLAVDIEAVNTPILESVTDHGIKAVMAYGAGDRPVTMEELAASGISDDIPEDGKQVVKVLTFDFKDDSLFVKAGDATYPLARMKLTIGYRKADKADGDGGSADMEAEAKDYIADVFVVTKSEDAPAEPG
jgi:hypothetical protein